MAPGATSTAIRIDGLRELRRQLNAVEKGLSKELADIFQPIAEKVAAKVRGKINSQTGKAAGTVKAAKAQKGAIVRAGGRIPYWGPLDFGGYPGRREFVTEGRYLYPTAEEEGPKAVDDIERGLATLIAKHGLG